MARKIDMLSTYLTTALKNFDHDPATSDFQRGYEAALVEVGKVLLVIDTDGDNTDEDE